MPRERTHCREPDATARATDKEGAHLGGGAKTMEAPLLLSLSICTLADNVVYVIRCLPISTKDEPTHRSE